MVEESGGGPVRNKGIIFGRSRPEKREVADRLRREMTPAEARLWQFLRANRLAGLHFRRQQVIDGFIADFYCHKAGCHKAGLIIELDGKIHERQHEYDEARDEILRYRGLRILRFSNEAVLTDMNDVLLTIHRAASTAIPELPPYEPFPKT